MTDPGSFPFEWLSLLLYAETHYRFRYFFSFLKKSEPEFIADAPFRIEPGKSIPLLLLSKDADKYPGSLLRATAILRGTGYEHRVKLIDKPITLDKKWWWKVVHIDPKDFTGWVEIDVRFELQGKNGGYTYKNDNHRTSSHKPLRVFVSKHSLPRFKGLHYGDAHTHSHYTEDQVEFGAPLEASTMLSKSLGLSFFAVTDHSYDLDDKVDDYLHNDPALPKWHSLQHEVRELNKRIKGFSILRGEEVSCRNQAGQNVHMLLLGTKSFVPGSGDSAERWFRTRSEHSIASILAGKGSRTYAFAAHPAEDVPFLQRLLLHRGNWMESDTHSRKLTGVQFANGSQKGFRRGLAQWVSALLLGHRMIALAGNDAHGNFNRFRQLRVPFLFMWESIEHRFGEMRTAVLFSTMGSKVSRVTEGTILEALASGRCLITNGPIAALSVRSSTGNSGTLGSSISGSEFGVFLEAKSTPEFGALKRILLWRGQIGRKKEECILETGCDDYTYSRQVHVKMKTRGYVRLEVQTSPANEFSQSHHFCFTNPIWINHPDKTKKPS